ncbi:sugar ABC transporter ATP-binding protein [Dactylosporangium sp. CA-233914]|uniref:sugar ABC transporter ATP-binding protein n=1 Tax=Dactylosporangium sp. CA-233914 TaxID=3239934 RepID=UPI003D8A2089
MDTSRTANDLLHVEGICMRFPGVQALEDVRLTVRPGEVLGLVGENGSGKSTLLKILAGRYSPDSGEVYVDGQRVSIANPAHALRLGIALVAQEVLIQPELTVAENLLDGRMPRRAGLVRWRETRRLAQEELESLGLALDPAVVTGRLPLHQQQMLAIARVVRRRPRLALFDEPTSSLTAQEASTVHAMIRQLRAMGTAAVYITHRLQDYFEVTDRVAVLRDGRNVATEQTRDVDEHGLVQLMVGRQQTGLFQRPATRNHRPEHQTTDGGPPAALQVAALHTDHLQNINLTVRPGEILGIAGQAGSGRTSLAETLFGRWPYRGRVLVNGRQVKLRSSRAAVAAGVALVPEDRKRSGLVLSMTVQENLTMATWSRMAVGGVRRPGRERHAAKRMADRLALRAAGLDVEVGTLSGGNQQKIAIGKWLARRPAILILDEPTRGVDVGAKAEIYALIEALAADGGAVIVVSSELLEVLRLADRIVVMADGRIVGEQPGAEASEESITAMAFAAPVPEGAR